MLLFCLTQPVLEQGSQTQSDSGAAWDAKKGYAGRIEKNYLKFWLKNQYIEIIRQNDFKILIFLVVRGPHWTLLRPACLRPLFWNKYFKWQLQNLPHLLTKMAFSATMCRENWLLSKNQYLFPIFGFLLNSTRICKFVLRDIFLRRICRI